MKTTKKSYMAPETEVTRVEIESEICGGSVEFGKAENDPNAIVANEQGINGDFGKANDFSSDTWEMTPGTN